LNAPTIGSSFATPAGATQTQANQMPTQVQQNISRDISSNKTQGQPLSLQSDPSAFSNKEIQFMTQDKDQ
jgi:hypothetical protein